MTGARVTRRLYAFEIVNVANFAIILLLAGRDFAVLGTMPLVFTVTLATLAGEMLMGIAIRAGVLAMRGEARQYLRIIRTRGWLTDTARLLVFGALLVHTYGWIKLVVPVYHPRLYDGELWRIDQRMFFGYSPNILFLNLFSPRFVLEFIDWAYVKIFFTSMMIAFAFFLSHPSRRIRSAFMTGNTLLWLAGAWLYMLVPSLGPVFRFPDVWLPYAGQLKVTHSTQVALMLNYQSILKIARGANLPIIVIYGVAAFPSLHVGYQTFVLLWMRKLWVYGEIVFGVFLLTIVLGSVITGWHYLIDSIAGIVLAAVCFAVAAAAARLRHWIALRQAMAGAGGRISAV